MDKGRTDIHINLSVEINCAKDEINRFFGVTIAASFGCPFEGEVAPSKVVEIVKVLVASGVDEISIADTIGVAIPTQVTELVELLRPELGSTPLRMHFHNTRNTGISNVYAAVQAGVKIFDSSCGGLGGCPFAPGASGNLATEDLVSMLHKEGYETGIYEKMLRNSAKLAAQLTN